MGAPGPLLAVNARDPEEVRVVLARGSRILDLRHARAGRRSLVGNLYLAEVRQVEPGLDAAFVDYGDSRAGFLHAGNVHPGYADPAADPFQVAATPTEAAAAAADADAGGGARAEGPTRPGRVEELLRAGRRLLVQVLRDPGRGKGATLTTYVSLAGRLLVLMPSLGRPGVSRRIEEAGERERLRGLVAGLAGADPLGVIARTAAAGARKAELQRDLDEILRRWRELGRACAVATGPGLLLAEESPVVRAVRDLLAPDLEQVVVDEEESARELEAFLERYAPEQRVPVERYRASRPLFEALDLERDYQSLFRTRVPVGSGATIVIHETEALTAVDVNSGRLDRGSLEETARECNKLAAVEIARQLRLRDVGGIVVVDFIDMQEAAHRREVEQVFRQALKADRARFKAGRLGAFGLMPLTRRRQGTGLPPARELVCRHCGGTGTVAAFHAGALRVLRRLRALGGPARVRAHPGVVEVLQGPLAVSLEQLGQTVELVADPQVAPGDPVLEGA